MPRLLEPAELEKALRGLDGWRRDGNFISRTFEFESFMEGIEFVDRVAVVAERQEHHPDVHIRYTTVKLALQTHSEGGVTSWDLGLAREIQKVAPEAKGAPRASPAKRI